MAKGHTVYALIRSNEKWSALMSEFTEKEHERCLGMIGDLRAENLGLSLHDTARLLDIDIIIHAGAPMDITLEETIAKDIILQGTRRLLDVAKNIHMKKRLQKIIHIVGYMSPFNDTSVSMQENVFQLKEDIKRKVSGYEGNKFLADLLVRQEAHKEEIPLVAILLGKGRSESRIK